MSSRKKSRSRQMIEPYRVSPRRRAMTSLANPLFGRTAPTQMTLDQMKRIQRLEFKCNLVERASSPGIFDFSSVDQQTIFNNTSVVISRNRSETAENYAKYRRYGSVVFSPLVGYLGLNDKSVLLFGSKIGKGLSEWINDNKGSLWIKDQNKLVKCDSSLQKAGLQITTFLTRLHRNGEYVGNLLESMRFDDNSCVTFTKFKSCQNSAKGIQQDLVDLQSFMRIIMDSFSEASEDYNMFQRLFPAEYPQSEVQMQELSYVICHAPIFWRMEERYTFSSIWHTYRHGQEKYFQVIVKPDDLEGWKNKITSSNPLYVLYSRGVYEDDTSIVSLCRNGFVHYIENGIQSHDVVDEEIQNLGSAVFSKLYFAIHKKFQGNIFVSELQKGGLDYDKIFFSMMK